MTHPEQTPNPLPSHWESIDATRSFAKKETRTRNKGQVQMVKGRLRRAGIGQDGALSPSAGGNFFEVLVLGADTYLLCCFSLSGSSGWVDNSSPSHFDRASCFPHGEVLAYLAGGPKVSIRAGTWYPGRRAPALLLLT